ncbi:hypothetical protein KKC13_11305 [bacterium]|nr:hypothetical protein [bacterium]MBU1957755.1 hypothetical protein [bacterium]
MPIYKYQPYYQYDGVTLAQPFREELTQEEIEYNIESFFSDIDRYFDTHTTTFERLSENCLEITTDISETECDERVKRCLNSLDLYAHKNCTN